MTRMTRRAAVLPVLALAAVLLAGCATDDTAPAASADPTPTSSAPARPVTVVVNEGTKDVSKAIRTFRSCDKTRWARCNSEVAAQNKVVQGFADELRVSDTTGQYAPLNAALDRLAKAGRAAVKACRKADDQVCDQKMAQVRADQQTVLWDLPQG